MFSTSKGFGISPRPFSFRTRESGDPYVYLPPFIPPFRWTGGIELSKGFGVSPRPFFVSNKGVWRPVRAKVASRVVAPESLPGQFALSERAILVLDDKASITIAPSKPLWLDVTLAITCLLLQLQPSPLQAPSESKAAAGKTNGSQLCADSRYEKLYDAKYYFPGLTNARISSFLTFSPCLG